MAQMISGALVVGYLLAALFFLRFRRETGDRLFLAFAIAFALLAVQRLALALTAEATTAFYVVRLLAFVMILVAIVDKNRSIR